MPSAPKNESNIDSLMNFSRSDVSAIGSAAPEDLGEGKSQTGKGISESAHGGRG